MDSPSQSSNHWANRASKHAKPGCLHFFSLLVLIRHSPSKEELFKWREACAEEAIHVNILQEGCGQEELGSIM